MLDGALAGLVGLAQAAALDDRLWASWLERATSELGCIGGLMTVLEDGEMSLASLRTVRRTTELMPDYMARWAAYDPLVAPASRCTGSLVFSSLDYADDDRDETRGYRAWEQSHRVGHHAVVAVALGDARWKAGFSFHRDAADGVMPQAELAKLGAMLPAIERAIDLGFRQNQALDESFWDGINATRSGEALLLLDERGRVIRATDAALQIVRRKDGIAIAHDRLMLASAAVDCRLAGLIVGALRNDGPASGAMLIPRPRDTRPYLLKVQPLPRARRALAPFEAAALVTIVDPSASSCGTASRFLEAFGLTPREADLSHLLRQGHTLESAAATCGIAIATARIHLHHVFRKTRTGRQVELVALLNAVV